METPDVDLAHAPYISQMRGKWSAHDLFDARRVVQDLVETPGWDLIVGLVSGAAEHEDRVLKFGKTLEQAEYARKVGIIVGTQAPLLAVEAVLAYAERVQRELEQRHEAEQASAGVS